MKHDYQDQYSRYCEFIVSEDDHSHSTHVSSSVLHRSEHIAFEIVLLKFFPRKSPIKQTSQGHHPSTRPSFSLQPIHQDSREDGNQITFLHRCVAQQINEAEALAATSKAEGPWYFWSVLGADDFFAVLTIKGLK